MKSGLAGLGIFVKPLASMMRLLLLFLFLLLPVIGKLQDISHATQMASRYAAFDATVHNDEAGSYKPPAQLAAEVRRRYFSRPDAPIKTDDTAGDFDAHRNPLWTDPAGNPLIPRFSDISVSFGASQSTAHRDAFTASPDGVPFSIVPLANHGRIGLNAPGIYRANISVPLANLPAGFLPPSDRPQFQMGLELQPGTDTRQTKQVVEDLSRWLADRQVNPEVSTSIGYVAEGGPRVVLALTPPMPASHVGYFTVTVKDAKQLKTVMERTTAWMNDHHPDVRIDPKLFSRSSNDAGAVAYDLDAVLDGLDAPDVEPDRAVELQRPPARGRLR